MYVMKCHDTLDWNDGCHDCTDIYMMIYMYMCMLQQGSR